MDKRFKAAAEHINKTLIDIRYPNGIPMNDINYYQLDCKPVNSTKFFDKYVCKAEGELVGVLNGQLFLGANNESICPWVEEFEGATDEEIMERIIDGKIDCYLHTKGGKAICDFIRRFKRIPTEDELNGITEFMQTYEALG